MERRYERSLDEAVRDYLATGEPADWEKIRQSAIAAIVARHPDDWEAETVPERKRQQVGA